MRLFKNVLEIGLFFSLAVLIVANVNAVSLTPTETVKVTSQEIANRVDTEKERLKLHPEYIKVIVEDLVVPHFDFELMAELVLEKNWPAMNESQSSCFTRAFKNLLVRRYADNFLGYGDHEIFYESEQNIGEKGVISVKQIIAYKGIGPVHVDYRMRPVQSGWKVVDLAIEDVSLLKIYRRIFSDEIHKQGLEGFLNSFKECN